MQSANEQSIQESKQVTQETNENKENKENDIVQTLMNSGTVGLQANILKFLS